MKKYKQGTPLHITWEDITATNGWHDPSKEHTLIVVETVGMFLKRDKNTLSVVQSHAIEGHNVSEALTMPWNCIKKVKILK
mgnify:CR=1 FL=1